MAEIETDEIGAVLQDALISISIDADVASNAGLSVPPDSVLSIVLRIPDLLSLAEVTRLTLQDVVAYVRSGDFDVELRDVQATIEQPEEAIDEIVIDFSVEEQQTIAEAVQLLNVKAELPTSAVVAPVAEPGDDPPQEEATNDVPSITADTAVADTITMTTQDADAAGDNTATASFASAFASAAAADGDYGADGAGTITVGSYALSLASGVSSGDASGLTSSGNDVLLREIGGVIQGYYTGVDGDGDPTETIVFSLSVNGSGVVTLTQNEAVDHGADGTFTDDTLALADDLVSLSGVATITDSDGDTDTATYSVDLGGNVTFGDDVPSIAVEATADSLQVDETDLNTDAIVDFSGNFSAAAGADGQASLVYSLTISSTGVDSGVATTAGNSVFLYVDPNDSDVILGLEGNGTTADASGDVAFRVSVDGTTGEVTLDQEMALDHPDDADPNDAISLGMSVLYLQAVVTDNDGDTATETLDLSGAISFLDDGPSINTDSDGDAANLVLKDNDIDNTTINFDAGEDGLPGLTFNITSGNAVETIGGETVKFVEPGSTDVYDLTWSVSLDNSTVTAEYTDNLGATQTAFDLVLSVSDSSSGTVTAEVQQGSFLTEAGFVNFTPSDGVSVSGGNNDYFGLPNISNTQTDVIVSASEGVTKTTVNTTNATFGAGNAFVNAASKSSNDDQEIVFEFYTNSVTSGSTNTIEFDSDGDGVSDPAETALINNFTFTVENYDSDARYKVEVKVNGNWTDYTTGANAQLVNGTNVLYNPNTVSGVNGITQLAITNGTDYEAVRITAVTEQTGTSQQYDGGKFKVTVDGIGSLEPIESDIAIRIPINLTDGDGDTTSGTIAFGIDKDDTDPPEVDFNAPIVLDLGTVGVQYVGVDDGVNFSSSMNDSINTAWVTPDDGILVIDANKSGTIDHLNEFVFTEWSNSATTDMHAVHEVFDTNKNYFLDEQDYYFDLFYVWQDLNSDGASDQNELLSLSDLGIEKIGLNYFKESQSRIEADGDVVVFGQSKVYFENGTTTLAEDAAFRYSDSPPQQLFEKNLTIAEIENVESAHIHDVILKVDNPALEREVNSALIVDVIDGKITVGLDTDEVLSGVLSNSVEAFIWIDATYTNGDNVLEELILEISPTGISDVEFGFDLVEDNATFDNDIVASLAEIANQTSGLEIGASSHFDINYDEINLVHIANTAEDLQDI